jgi:hypothetical protein
MRNRVEILESDSFRYRFGERVRDEIENLPLAVIANYIEAGDDLAAGRYFGELVKPIIDEVISEIIEDDDLLGHDVQI